jgi:hypothetical protein
MVKHHYIMAESGANMSSVSERKSDENIAVGMVIQNHIEPKKETAQETMVVTPNLSGESDHFPIPSITHVQSEGDFTEATFADGRRARVPTVLYDALDVAYDNRIGFEEEIIERFEILDKQASDKNTLKETDDYSLVQVVKESTGNDRMVARELYSEAKKIDDSAVWNRIRDNILESMMNPTLAGMGEPQASPLRIVMTDSMGPYVSHHYTECENTSTELLKHTRGTISRDEVTVCKTFNFTPEYIGKSQEAIDALNMVDWADAIIYPAHEGTNLRLWCDQGIWHLSSFKKIDAFRSRWGCRESHGQMFYDGLEYMLKNEKITLAPGPKAVWDRARGASAPLTPDRENEAESKVPCDAAGSTVSCDENRMDSKACFDFYCSLLSPHTVYTFVVLSTIKNRIVCIPNSHSQPLYFTGEFVKTNDGEWVFTKDNTSGISPPDSDFAPEDGKSVSESLLSWTENLNPYLWQGMMVHYKVGTADFGSIKLTSATYQALASLRGNWPSIPFRYLQLREWSDQAQAFRALYPEHLPIFDEYERILDEAADQILAGYTLRYIKKQFVMLPQELFFIAKDLLEQWKVDHKRVTKQTVQEKINSLGSIRLNYLIKAARNRALARPITPAAVLGDENGVELVD